MQTLAPILLISLMAVFTLVLIYTIYQGRRRRMALEAAIRMNEPLPQKRSKKKRVFKPKLFEVDVRDVEDAWDEDLEALLVSFLPQPVCRRRLNCQIAAACCSATGARE